MRILLMLTVFILSQQSTAKTPQADLIVVEKSRRELILYNDHKVIKSYSVSLGRTPIGKKTYQGDGKTPEGRYFISNKKTDSAFFKALQISYPNKKDLAFAKKNGRDAGGQIMIHGLVNNLSFIPDFLQDMHTFLDWTDGCIAVTNEEMDEIFSLVPVKTPIWIFP